MRRVLLTALLLYLPALALAAEEAAHEVNPKMEIFRIINFVVFAALLYKFAGKAVVNLFKNRKEVLEKAIEESEKARKEAEARYQEVMKRIENADAEMKQILESAEKEREKQIAQIRQETEAMIARIREQAKAAAELEVKKAKIELQREAVDLAVSLAEGLLREKLTPEDQKRLVEEYITKMKEVH